MGKSDMSYIVPYGDSFIVNEASCDTIYRINAAGNLSPLVVRTPSVQGMESQITLWVDFETDDYLFMTRRTISTEQGDMMPKRIMYDKRERKIFDCGWIFNLDTHKELRMQNAQSENNKTVIYNLLSALSAIDLLEESKTPEHIKTRLKEIQEEDNPVLVIYTFK